MGMVMEVREEQLENAAALIEVTLLGMAMDPMEHPKNAPSPMKVTLFGIVKETSVFPPG